MFQFALFDAQGPIRQRIPKAAVFVVRYGYGWKTDIGTAAACRRAQARVLRLMRGNGNWRTVFAQLIGMHLF